MSPYPNLDQLRIGCVQYLNAKPLIFGYEGRVHFDHPSRLAGSLASGDLDVALVSTFELLRMPDYLVADDISISSRGEVFSVFLAYQGDLQKIGAVVLDPASLTAANLLRCLLAEYHQLHPRYLSAEDCKDQGASRLLIGNQAIDFRREHGDEFKYLDLGAEWIKHTGLPFVFALWLIRSDTPNASAAAAELRKIKQLGLSSVAQIVRAEKRYDAEFETRYLGGHIRYELGPDEKASVAKFREMLAKYSLIPAGNSSLVFI